MVQPLTELEFEFKKKKETGVFFSTDLSFHFHVQAVCRRAFKTFGFVMRTSNEFELSRSLETIMLPRLVFIRICVCARDTFATIDSHRLERVERCFLSSAAYTLKIDRLLHNYYPALRALDLTSLAGAGVQS